MPTPRQRVQRQPTGAPTGRFARAVLENGAGPANRIRPRSLAAPVRADSARSGVIRRHYLDGGQTFTGSMFSTEVSGVEVVSYADRHTIIGLLNNKGGAKKLNTVVLKPIEMQLVAADAHACAWNAEEGRVSVTDGTTFLSCGIRWGIDARPNANPPSIHVYPTEGGEKAIDIGAVIPALRAFKGQVDKGTDVDDAKDFAVKLAERKKWDVPKLLVAITAMRQMGDV